MDGAGRQHHAVAGTQANLAVFEREGDRAGHAVEHFLIGVAVRAVPVSRPIGPGVAALRLLAQPGHEFCRLCHDAILQSGTMPRFLADANVGRLARWLRAYGYDAAYAAHIDDSQLIGAAPPRGAGLPNPHSGP